MPTGAKAPRAAPVPAAAYNRANQAAPANPCSIHVQRAPTAFVSKLTWPCDQTLEIPSPSNSAPRMGADKKPTSEVSNGLDLVSIVVFILFSAIKPGTHAIRSAVSDLSFAAKMNLQCRNLSYGGR